MALLVFFSDVAGGPHPWLWLHLIDIAKASSCAVELDGEGGRADEWLVVVLTFDASVFSFLLSFSWSLVPIIGERSAVDRGLGGLTGIIYVKSLLMLMLRRGSRDGNYEYIGLLIILLMYSAQMCAYLPVQFNANRISSKHSWCGLLPSHLGEKG
ncbi:hypothetical protein B0T22DRAFT_459096 [Podospora appendiculata]|uniref:Uncharacterized protein n=1 Tax=Podospora appendiculata TaxID=314037 RepID=A0AAE0X948_9PEZI|nr:hypothetical protein B0T22DRAFT_459096 [Podospora appendiculata]